MSEPHVRCPKCRGRGSIAMPSHMLATIRAIARLGACSTVDVVASLRGSMRSHSNPHTAMCNRLRALEELGLVYSEPSDGRSRRWSISANGRMAIQVQEQTR